MQKTILTPGGRQGTKTQNSGSLRERKHEFVLREIERAAWELFATVGFDRATVEEISRQAGVSRRTFFRYFRAKEDVLSYSVENFGRMVTRSLCEAPMTRRPLAALEGAFLSVLEREMGDCRQPRELLGLMFAEPDLRGRFLCGLDQWVPELGKELARRKACRGDLARCRLVAALYCTAFDYAHLRWYREPEPDITTQVRQAFRQLREIGSREYSGKTGVPARRHR